MLFVKFVEFAVILRSEERIAPHRFVLARFWPIGRLFMGHQEAGHVIQAVMTINGCLVAVVTDAEILVLRVEKSDQYGLYFTFVVRKGFPIALADSTLFNRDFVFVDQSPAAAFGARSVDLCQG